MIGFYRRVAHNTRDFKGSIGGQKKTFLGIVAAVAVLSAIITWVVGTQITSPAESAAAAKPPTPSLLTVGVELKQLNQSVVLRGTVKPTASTEVLASGGGTPIVTGLPKAAGDEVNEGEVVAEISGRPVFVLQGSLPVFRDLRPGISGADVLQLEEALSRLGFNPGTVDETYDANTSTAVAAFYQDRGYLPKESTKDEQTEVRTAQQQVQADEAALAEATTALNEATKGVSSEERAQLDQAVVAAEAALANAKAQQKEAPGAESKAAVEQAELGVRQAKAERATRLNGADTTDLSAAVDRAERALAASKAELEKLLLETSTLFPGSEFVFVSQLPQQIASVSAKIGDKPTDAVLTISGSETIIKSAVNASDRQLLEVGSSATLEDSSLGISAPVTITKMANKPGGGDLKSNQYAIEFAADDPLPEEALEVSMRITIPVTASDGEVLVVPLAAVSSGPDGTSQVEVESDGETTIIAVNVGLTANGQVEVSPIDGVSLSEGDRVVVGQDLDLSKVGGDSPAAPAAEDSTGDTTPTGDSTPGTND